MLSGTVAAQLAPRISFDELDTDDNGALSRIEAAALPDLLERFDELDQNRNDLVQPHEYGPAEPLFDSASGGASVPGDPRGFFAPPDRNEPATRRSTLRPRKRRLAPART